MVLDGVLDQRVLDDAVLDAALAELVAKLRDACSTVRPLKSRKTADVIRSNLSLIAPIERLFLQRVP